MLYALYKNVVYFIEEFERFENENKLPLQSSMFGPLDSPPKGKTLVGHTLHLRMFNQLNILLNLLILTFFFTICLQSDKLFHAIVCGDILLIIL